MINNLSLIVVFGCAFFIVVCSILHKIEIFPSTKGILCLLMVSIIGALASGNYHINGGALALLAMLIVRQTYVAYKRGFL